MLFVPPEGGFAPLAAQRPWLLPLLGRMGVPILPQEFVSSPLLRACREEAGGGLGSLVANKLMALKVRLHQHWTGTRIRV